MAMTQISKTYATGFKQRLSFQVGHILEVVEEIWYETLRKHYTCTHVFMFDFQNSQLYSDNKPQSSDNGLKLNNMKSGNGVLIPQWVRVFVHLFNALKVCCALQFAWLADIKCFRSFNQNQNWYIKTEFHFYLMYQPQKIWTCII